MTDVDVIIGAFWDEGDREYAGMALVYYGSMAGLSPTPAWSVAGDKRDAYLGASVKTAGDVNGDGYTDVIVGVPGYHNDTGRVLVYYGDEEQDITHFTVQSKRSDRN